MNLIKRFWYRLISFFKTKEEIKKVYKAPLKARFKRMSEGTRKYLAYKKYKRGMRNVNCHFATTKGFTIKA